MAGETKLLGDIKRLGEEKVGRLSSQLSEVNFFLVAFVILQAFEDTSFRFSTAKLTQQHLLAEEINHFNDRQRWFPARMITSSRQIGQNTRPESTFEYVRLELQVHRLP